MHIRFSGIQNNLQSQIRRKYSALVHSGRLALLCMVGSAFVACGGDGGVSGPIISQQPSNSTSINGIAVPPDPGAAGAETVVGIDVNGNGIRDEIDRFIATKYGTNPVALKAARTSARVLQQILLTSAASKTSSVAVLQDNGDAGVCAGRGFREANLTSSKELDEIFVRTINTPARINQFKSVAATGGLFTRSATTVVCP